MADITSKKTESVNEKTVVKDDDKEKGVENVKHSKQAVKSPKPPLPPRPSGLSKIPPRKRISSPSKTPQHNKDTCPKDKQDISSSSPRPRRPPLPSNKVSIKTPEKRVGQGKKTEEIEISPPETSLQISTLDEQNVDEHIKSDIDNADTNSEDLQKSSISGNTINDNEVNEETIPKETSAQLKNLVKPSRPEKHKGSQHKTTGPDKVAVHTPERPKPPVRSPSVANDGMSNTLHCSSNTSTETPCVPKKHKITPPVAPKPQSPRGERKSENNKPRNSLGEQSSQQRTNDPEALVSDIKIKNEVETPENLDETTPSSKIDSHSVDTLSKVAVIENTSEELNTASQITYIDKKSEATEQSAISLGTEECLEQSIACNKETSNNVVSPLTPKSSKNEKHQKKGEKPPRPCAPSRKHEDVGDECSHDVPTPLVDNISMKPASDKDEELCNVGMKEIHENNKSKEIASPKPSRPLAPLITAEELKLTESHDYNAKEITFSLDEQSSTTLIKPTPNENSNYEISPKPSKPSRPVRPSEVPKTVKDVENNLPVEEIKQNSESLEHKSLEKPELPSNEKSAESKSCGESRNACVVIVDHEPQKMKPKRPSQPILHKGPEFGSITNVEKDEGDQSVQLSETTEFEEKEHETKREETVPDPEHKRTLPARPSRPVKPNSDMAKKTNKHDGESESDLLMKKTGCIKPTRPPKPCDTKHNIQLETSSSFVHKTESIKHKPPRPEAPHHGKQISVDNENVFHDHHNENDKEIHIDANKSVETQPKTAQSSNPEGNPSENEGKNADATKQVKAINEEDEEDLNELMSSKPDKISGELHDNIQADDEESLETKDVEKSNKRTEQENLQSFEHSMTFNIAGAPPPNETSSVDKSKTVPFITEKKKDQGKQEKKKQITSENEKSTDRHNVRFRVSSLSKTEVESFNKTQFLENLKERDQSRRKSEEDSVTPPTIKPKPSRPRPPSNSKKTGTSSEREVHDNISEGRRHEDGLENKIKLTLSDKFEHNDVKSVDDKVSDKNISDSTNPDKQCSTVINVKDHHNRKTADVGEKKCEHVEVTPTQKVVGKVKKVKRKAPPVPDEKHNEVQKKQDIVKSEEKESTNEQECLETSKVNIEGGEQQGENAVSDLTIVPEKELPCKTTEPDKENEENVHDPVGCDTNEHREFSEVIKGHVALNIEKTETLEDKQEVNDVCHTIVKSSSAGENDVTSPTMNLETQGVDQNTSVPNTPSPYNESSKIEENENIHLIQTPETVQSPKKKKIPPPKPKRTSSLKRDSKLTAPKREDAETETVATTEVKRLSSPGVLDQVSEENDTNKSSADTRKSIETSTKAVTFDENTESKRLFRSKSFGKDRKKNSTDTGGERLLRSFSFGGKKKHQPPKSSPSKFFVEKTTNDSGDSEKVSEELSKDETIKQQSVEYIIEVEDASSSQENLVDPETFQTDTKHDSCLTTDSESESEKQEENQKSKTYYISREILTTERTFVDTVKLVSEDFREALTKGNEKFGRAVIPDETLQDIMLNISQIYKFDSEFLNELENRMESWEEEQRIGDIIKKFSPFLKMYKTYIQGYDNAMAILTEALKKYPQFADVVREFECSERCQNLTVGMYMLKPIQRIPSYRLLLIDYLKHLSKDSLDHKDVSDALAIVSDVATHINEDMKRVDNFEEVLKVQRSLVGQVEIVKPGRELIKEGALMKLSRKEMQPRMFYLLTDVLLYTTPVANNQYRLNLSLPLEEIQVELPVSPDFENEFSIISTKKSFILSASTAEERDEWLEALRNASDEIRKKKITFHVAKKEKMEALYDAQHQNEDKEGKLGSKAPVWIPDVRVSMCMVCTDDFTVTNRRHHCRACGKVICGSCSSNSSPLAYLNNETARVCDVCYDELREKTNVAPSAVETKENGITAERKNSAPRINPLKKSRRPKLFKSKEVPAVEESTISGYLKTRVGKKWHKKWYVVKDNVLYASKASSDPAAQETRPLLGYDVRGPEKMDGDSKKIVFQLIHAGTEPVVLQTDNMKHGEQWVNALRRATILPQ